MKMRFFYLIVLLTSLSHFSFFVPFFLIKNAENGLPFSIAIGLLIVFFNNYLQLYVYNKYKKMTMVEINKKLFGKNLGNVLTTIFAALNLITSAFTFSAGVKLASQYLLYQSPQWHIIFPTLLLLVLIYRVPHRNYLYCKSFFAVLSFTWVLLLILLGIRNTNFLYIQGTLAHSIKPPTLSSIAATTFFFGGVSHLALFNPEFKEKISFKKTMLLQLVVGLPLLLMSLAIPLGIWGPIVAKKVSFLLASTLDTMAIDMFVIERVLYIGIPLLISLMFFNTQNFSFVAYNLLKGLNPKNKKYAVSVEVIILIIFSITALKINLQQLGDWFDIYLQCWLFINLGLKLLKYVLAKHEGRRSG